MSRLQSSGLVEQYYLRAMNFGVAGHRDEELAQHGPTAISLKVLAPVLRFLGLMVLLLPVLCFLGELALARVTRDWKRRYPPARRRGLGPADVMTITTLHI